MLIIKRYKTNPPNIKVSIKNPVDIEKLLIHSIPPQVKDKLTPLRNRKAIHFWDLGKTLSPHAKSKPDLLIVCSDFSYYGQIADYIEDPSGKLGAAIGWTKTFYGRPYENIVLLTDIIIITNPLHKELSSFISNHLQIYKLPYNSYQLSGDIEKTVIDIINKGVLIDFPSQEITPDKIISNSEPKPSSIKQEFLKPLWLREHIDNVKSLMTQSDHSERDHEPLVEELFILLGYKKYEEIRYRPGRMDILILKEERPLITIEVKKVWDLKNILDKAIDQAYKYASKCGSRYVIVTNGNNYWLFDRKKGLSIDENKLGEWEIIKLTTGSVELINALKKNLIS